MDGTALDPVARRFSLNFTPMMRCSKLLQQVRREMLCCCCPDARTRALRAPAHLCAACLQGSARAHLHCTCAGKWLEGKNDASETLMPCMDLIYVYAKTYVLRNALFSKFIAIFRSSPLESLTESNLRVRDLRTQNIKKFLLTYLSTATKKAAASKLGCLASGNSFKLHCWKGGSVPALESWKINFFRDLVKSVFGEFGFSFAKCANAENCGE